MLAALKNLLRPPAHPAFDFSQLAGEPAVRSGVWEHSGFRRDPLARLRRTGFAAMVTVYGPQTAARRMIAVRDAATGR